MAMPNETLINLLRAKDEAQRVFSNAIAACRQAEVDGLSEEQRIVLDLHRRKALDASCKADKAYHDALDAFCPEGGV